MQLSRTGKKWISVIVTIRPVFPDPVTYIVDCQHLQVLQGFIEKSHQGELFGYSEFVVKRKYFGSLL